jgi:hypothetical protein
MAIAGFPELGPTLHGLPTEPKSMIVTRLFSCWQVSCFDAAVTLAGDVDCEGGVLQPISDGVGDTGQEGHRVVPISGNQVALNPGNWVAQPRKSCNRSSVAGEIAYVSHGTIMQI